MRLSEGNYVRGVVYGKNSYNSKKFTGVKGSRVDGARINPVVKNDPDNSKDTSDRMEIQRRIRELKKMGFPKDEAIKRIKTEFADCKYTSFFESWVENVYKKDRERIDRYGKQLGRLDGEER